MLQKLSLRLRILLIFAGLAAGAALAFILGLVVAAGQIPPLPPTAPGAGATVMSALTQAAVVSLFLLLGLVTGVWYLFDINVARPIETLAGALRARAHAGVAGEIDSGIAHYLGDLAPAARAAATTLAETRNALAESVARETTRLAAENTRLEALLADVPGGVLLCSADHQVVFYNGPASEMLGGAGAGLDRSLFDYLHAGPLQEAVQRLAALGDDDAVSDLLCATRAGGRVLAARMRLLDGGYVLSLRDVTAELALHERQNALLSEVFDAIRRPAASLGTLLGVLPEGAPLPPAMEQALRAESSRLGEAVTDLARRHDEGRAETLPLAPVRASDLADGIAARFASLGIGLDTDEIAPLLLRCNGSEIVCLLGRLGAALARETGLRDFRFALTEAGADALLRLCWNGPALPVGVLEGWLDSKPGDELPDTTGRAVLAVHGTDIWPETRGAEAALVLPLRAARRVGPRPAPIPRAVVYDFDLLSRARNDRVAETRLEDLTCVVFDTETTGLLPDRGDDIVQIAAVRIVNGKLVAGEVFDTLVNPGRPIPPASTAVHGITDAMVATAPGIAEVGRAFHKFAEGAVLVAHNAPFDLEFLRLKQHVIGARFDNPVLDTVLLSAVIYGQHEIHSLDALSHRLDITIPEEARHTALGDTVATADAFLKLIPMLKGRGFATFGAVVAEMRRHGRLLRDMNEDA